METGFTGGFGSVGRAVGLDDLTGLFRLEQFYALVLHCSMFSVPRPPKDALFISFPPSKFFVCTVAAFVPIFFSLCLVIGKAN